MVDTIEPEGPRPEAAAEAAAPTGPGKMDAAKNFAAGIGINAMGYAGKAFQQAGKYPVIAGVAIAGLTGLAALLWPKKNKEIAQADGSTATKKKTGFMKVAAVTLGLAATAGHILNHMGPTKGYADTWAGKMDARRATTTEPSRSV